MNKKKSILVLCLLVPAPSLGAYSGLVLFPNTVLGASLFTFSKFWLFALPVFWIKFVDKQPFHFSPPKRGGFLFGACSGLAISVLILGTYFLLGDSLIDPSFLVKKMEEAGLANLPTYLGCAAYWIGINSVLEEYVWRWFVVKQSGTFMKPWGAVLFSAFAFTLHHIVAMKAFMGTPAVIICSIGVFSGGAIWSYMYVKYRSVWPAYLSHAIVDLCIFAIGASIIFG